MPSAILPEQTRREAVSALNVVLSDGRSWGLSLPVIRRYPIIIHELDDFGRAYVRVEVGSRIGYGLKIRRIWDLVLAASRNGSETAQGEMFRRFLVALLRSAHDIDQAQAEMLLDPARVDLGEIACVLIPAAFGPGDLPCSVGR